MIKTRLEDANFEDFYFGTSVKNEEKIISTSEINDGAILKSLNGEKIKLISKLTSSTGGEGSVYATDKEGCVAKIYSPKGRTDKREKKLKMMTGYENTNKHVCWPTDVLYFENNGKREFVGFLMPYVSGEQLLEIYKNLTTKYGEKGFTREKQINMILEILKTFKWLHDRNILVGDIKLENIMFNEKTYEICLIDMDSVQINEYNCDVATFGYDAPEVVACQGKDNCNEKDEDDTYIYFGYYKCKYREKKHECFALATLIYQILMNEFPYENTNFSDEYDDTDEKNRLKVEHEFAYSNDENKYANGQTIARLKNGEDMRVAHAIWSHLPSNLKNLFINTFSKSNIRYPDETWIYAFEVYQKSLKNLLKKDKEANQIYTENAIDYKKVEIFETKSFNEKGFTIKQALRKILKRIDGKKLSDKTLLEIEDGLKKAKELKVGDSFKFRIDYNIGVLKQISCEYKSLL